MEHPSLFVAIDLVEDADVEHPVVDDEEEEGPFDERPVESFYSFFDEGGFIVEVTCGEEVACCDEEQRHVEFEDKLTEPSWRFRMGHNHQNDCDPLRN